MSKVIAIKLYYDYSWQSKTMEQCNDGPFGWPHKQFIHFMVVYMLLFKLYKLTTKSWNQELNMHIMFEIVILPSHFAWCVHCHKLIVVVFGGYRSTNHPTLQMFAYPGSSLIIRLNLSVIARQWRPERLSA